MIYSSFTGSGITAGELEFQLLASMYPSEVNKYGVFLQNFTVRFIPRDGEDTTSNSDRIYENAVNENYINELDEIELKISSYNHDGAGYGKVISASDITPLSRLYDNYMVNKKFINAGGTIDYKMNQFQCIMIEV